MADDLRAKFVYRGRTFRLYLHPETKGHGTKMRPVDTISRRIFEGSQFYELGKMEAMLSCITADSIVFDCGANIGNHTVFWGSRCKEVHAFEPFPASFSLLERNMAVNHIPGKAYNVLLGNDPGRYRVETTEVSRGATHFVKDENGDFVSVRLDDIVEQSVKPNFIKIDVEGDELDLLKGAHRILSESHPVLWIEVHFFYHDDLDVQILRHLDAYGYVENKDVILTRRRKK